MQTHACAADARASLQQTLLRNCKTAGEQEAAVICAALAAVKGAHDMMLLATCVINCVFYRHNSSRTRDPSRNIRGAYSRCCIVSHVSFLWNQVNTVCQLQSSLRTKCYTLTVLFNSCHAEFSSLLPSLRQSDLQAALDLAMFKVLTASSHLFFRVFIPIVQEAAVLEAATLLSLSSFAVAHTAPPCLLHHLTLSNQGAEAQPALLCCPVPTSCLFICVRHSSHLML
jgi:hypothetical protein